MEKQALAVREQQWYQTITTAKESGQSIKSWCAENGVPLSSFYSWQRKMRSALVRQESVQFEELSPSSPKTAAISPTQITLHIRDVTVELPADLSSDQISEIIRGIRNAGWHPEGGAHLHRLRIYRSAARNRRSGTDRTESVFAGSLFQQPVSVLRQKTGPDQSPAVGGRWICITLQACRDGLLSVATDKSRDAEPELAGIPVAAGRSFGRPA